VRPCWRKSIRDHIECVLCTTGCERVGNWLTHSFTCERFTLTHKSAQRMGQQCWTFQNQQISQNCGHSWAKSIITADSFRIWQTSMPHSTVLWTKTSTRSGVVGARSALGPWIEYSRLLRLAHFHPKVRLVLVCDARAIGVGAVLFHRYMGGTKHTISCAPKTTFAETQNYAPPSFYWLSENHRSASIVLSLEIEFISITSGYPLLSSKDIRQIRLWNGPTWSMWTRSHRSLGSSQK